MRNKPSFFKDGKISSALFKDSKGVSVNKDNGRPEEEIVGEENRLHAYYLMNNPNLDSSEYTLKAIVCVAKETCDSAKVIVVDNPLPENEHHALIIQSHERVRLTASQAKQLARNTRVMACY